MLRGDGLRLSWWRIGVVPSFQEGGDGRLELVGVSNEVKRACPEITCECRSQVADGFADSPTEKFRFIVAARSSGGLEMTGSE